MQIFLSYASEDQALAEAIHLALIGSDHQVFFDQSSLPAGGDYHGRIQDAIQASDAFIFLISPDSIDPGSYTLTEMKHAQAKWQHPKQRVLPVMLRPTEWDDIPIYLKSVTVLEPIGNIAAEVLLAVEMLKPGDRLPPEILPGQPVAVEHEETVRAANAVVLTNRQANAERRFKLTIAVISAIGVLGTALLGNWDKVFPVQSSTPRVIHQRDKEPLHQKQKDTESKAKTRGSAPEELNKPSTTKQYAQRHKSASHQQSRSGKPQKSHTTRH